MITRSHLASHRFLTLIMQQTLMNTLSHCHLGPRWFPKDEAKATGLGSGAPSLQMAVSRRLLFSDSSSGENWGPGFSGLERSLEPAGEEVFGKAGRSLAYFSPH